VAGATALIVPKPPVADAGEIIQAALRNFVGPVFAVLDRYARRIYVFTDSGERATILAALAGSSQSLILAPDSGQTGNALAWHVDSEVGSLANAQRDLVITSVKPKRSAFAVLNLIASQGIASFAWIDQTSPQVGFADFADAAAVTAALEASAPDAAIELKPYTQGNFQ
jgi:hypothetical protein